MENESIVYNLISILEDIYHKYQEILDVDYGSDEYYKLIGELTRLTVIEDNIISLLPNTKQEIEKIDNFVKHNYIQKKISMYNFILNRFDSIICQQYEKCEGHLSPSDNIIQSDINIINDEIYFNFIKRLNNAIERVKREREKRNIRKIQLSYIYSFKNISDKYIKNNLSLENNFIENREEHYRGNLNRYQSFILLKNRTTAILCEELLKRNIYLSHISNNFHNDMFYLSINLLFRSVLMDTNDEDFINIRNDFYNELEHLDEDNKIIKKLKRSFDLEYERRLSTGKYQTGKSLDAEFLDNFIKLMKLESFIYDKLIQNDNEDQRIIKSAIEYEKELVNEIDINVDNIETVLAILSNDLDFFADTNVYLKKNAITLRIKNLFDVFYKLDLASGIIEKNYKSIINNHIVDTIKQYDGNLSTIKYNVFIYPELTDDFILLDGNYQMMERFNDELTSYSLNQEKVHDYCYDKNKQLYRLFTEIIDDLVRNSDIYSDKLRDLYEFKICELSDIINNVSMEYLCRIKEEIENLSDIEIKDKIITLFN